MTKAIHIQHEPQTARHHRCPSQRRKWNVFLILLMFVGLGSGMVTSCLVSQTSLECRPCGTQGTCGSSFQCLDSICRPLHVLPVEFVRCEPIPSQGEGDGGETHEGVIAEDP